MLRRVVRASLAFATLGGFVPGLDKIVHGQSETRRPGGVLLERPDLGPVPGAMEPNLPPAPGALLPNPFSLDPGIIGGKQRGVSRISRPSNKGRSPSSRAMPSEAGLPVPSALRRSLPAEDQGGLASSFALIGLAEDEGAADGLTLDAAIQKLMTCNLDLLALRYEIPQAQADILTAGLRANPLLYVDTQFIPYGSFTDQRPGGPTQYDLNITYPLDVTHKRQARVQVACLAKRVLEAQYQDVVRRQIGNLYRAFVDLQAARIGYLAAEAAVREQEQIVERERQKSGRGAPSSDSERLLIQLEKTRGALADAGDTLDDSREALALLINLPPEETARLEPRGRLRDASLPSPPIEELTRLALANRPDLASSRLGLNRAEAEIRLARANRLDDIYLFYDPITYQDNRPAKALSARSWDVGLAIPLPIYNRNQGNIARAQSNLIQTHIELNALDRRVVSEVRKARREYVNSREALDRIEASMLPHARAARQQATAEFAAGKLTQADYLDNLDSAAETADLYRDALIRHRRSTLDLNTTVGLRLFP